MLTITHLTKKYPNSDRTAVTDLNFELKEGEIFGFLGKNGAGKSTTIKCITGILPFEEGEITICGHSIKTDPINAKFQMGYVPDNHSVYEKLTGREYVYYVADLYRVSRKDRRERFEYYLDLFKLRAAADTQIKSYSHGMKQKICIIAALIHEPKLWVLDEPMMGLDPQSTAEIVSYMKEHCRKGNTVFFSSHNLDLVKKLCHRVAIINDGKLVDIMQLAGRPENKANLEEKFFRITGTYDKRLLQDYADQEMSSERPTFDFGNDGDETPAHPGVGAYTANEPSVMDDENVGTYGIKPSDDEGTRRMKMRWNSRDYTGSDKTEPDDN